VPNVSETTRRIPAAGIHAVMIDAFRACGLPEADAGTVAEAMLDADLSGSDAHGIFRLAGYVGLLKRGQINPRAIAVHGKGRDEDRAVDTDLVHRRHHLVTGHVIGPVRHSVPGSLWIVRLVSVDLGIDDRHPGSSSNLERRVQHHL
jgi:hypothetical protein